MVDIRWQARAPSQLSLVLQLSESESYVTRLETRTELVVAAEAFVGAAESVPAAGVLAVAVFVGSIASDPAPDTAGLSFVEFNFRAFAFAAWSSTAGLRRFFVVVHWSVFGLRASERSCCSCANCSAAARSFRKTSSCSAVSLRTLAVSDSSLCLMPCRNSTSASSSGRNWFFSFEASSKASCLAATMLLISASVHQASVTGLLTDLLILQMFK